MEVTYPQSGSSSGLIPSRIGIWKCSFLRTGQNRSTQRKTSRSKRENQQQRVRFGGRIQKRICDLRSVRILYYLKKKGSFTMTTTCPRVPNEKKATTKLILTAKTRRKSNISYKRIYEMFIVWNTLVRIVIKIIRNSKLKPINFF